jgi:hypothetical protein
LDGRAWTDVITIAGKSYIVDFSNPRDIRSYFSGFSLKINNKWRLYDVSGQEAAYNPKPLFWQYKTGYDIIWRFIYMGYLINVGFFPEWLNVWDLTRDMRISEHWEVTVLVVCLIACGIGIALGMQRTKIILPEKELVLSRVHNYRCKVSLRLHVAFAYLKAWVFFILCFIWGLYAANYAHLILFGILPCYGLLFVKFTDGIDKVHHRYQIVEKEEK